MNTNAAFTMTDETENLLVRFLDGTLSTDEQTRFEALLRENPAFAEEVRAISSFEDVLDGAHLEERWLERVDTAFLSQMQQQLTQAVLLGTASGSAASIISATSASISTSASSAASTGASVSAGIGATSLGVSKLTALLTGSIIAKSLVAAAVCGGIGYGVWKYQSSERQQPLSAEQFQKQSSSSETFSKPTQDQANTPDAAVSLTPPQSLSAADADSQKDVVSSTKQPEAASKLTKQNLESEKIAPENHDATTISNPTTALQDASNGSLNQEAKSDASIESASGAELRSKIEQLAAQVRIKEQNGDKATFAFEAKKLAMLERTAGRLSESAEHFDKALKAAQMLKLRELEGEIRAEQSLLFREQGNADKALISLREAVKILTEERSPKVSKWAKELERREK